jgi:hypothetical protein
MASSSFTLAIDALIRERDYKFVSQIAADYNLNVDELYEKYTTAADKLAPKPVKKRKATVEMLDNAGEPIAKKAKGACQGITSKKETCKFSALKGGCFCKRHQKAHEEEEAAKQSGVVVPIKKVKEPKEPKPKHVEPVHNHSGDDIVHEDCDLCQSHGAIFGGIFEAEEAIIEEAPTPDEEEAPEEPDEAPMEDRLKMLIEGADEPEPQPYKSTGAPLEEEEFSDAEF